MYDYLKAKFYVSSSYDCANLMVKQIGLAPWEFRYNTIIYKLYSIMSNILLSGNRTN